jgi:transcriptional regulator with XRE-family HTH domain
MRDQRKPSQYLAMRIKQAMAKQELTYRQVAKLCGISVKHAHNIANGHCIPSVDLAYTACQELRIKPLEIFKAMSDDGLWNQAGGCNG